MRERIVEIIIYIMNELQNDIPLNEIDLSVLSNNGYTATEISTAFSWLYDKISIDVITATETGPAPVESHRILHEAERMVISTEGFGYLIQLQEMKLLKHADVESVIDRIMLGGYYSVGVPEMKSIVASLLLELDDSWNTGSRIMINGKDTIH